MRIRATGRAGQQQARSPRAGGLYQSAWSSGAVRQSGRRRTSRTWPCGAETSSSFSQYQTAATRLSRELAPILARIFDPDTQPVPPCDRNRIASADGADRWQATDDPGRELHGGRSRRRDRDLENASRTGSGHQRGRGRAGLRSHRPPGPAAATRSGRRALLRRPRAQRLRPDRQPRRRDWVPFRPHRAAVAGREDTTDQRPRRGSGSHRSSYGGLGEDTPLPPAYRVPWP